MTPVCSPSYRLDRYRQTFQPPAIPFYQGQVDATGFLAYERTIIVALATHSKEEEELSDIFILVHLSDRSRGRYRRKDGRDGWR